MAGRHRNPVGEVTLTATDAHLISASLALWPWCLRGMGHSGASGFFVPLVLCAGSFSAVVNPGFAWVGQPHPHCTVVHPFVYGFSSVPVLKEMLQKLKFCRLFHLLFPLPPAK